MKSLALTLLISVGLASGLRTNKLKLNQMFNDAELPADTATHTCSQAITAVKSQATLDYNSIINAGKPWTDPAYNGSSAIYWQDFNKKNTSPYIASINWARANTTNPGSSLFGTSLAPNYNNIHQGALGDCYYLCSVSAVAETPDRIKKIFLTQTYNKAGIFALTVYVRGIPV